MPFSQFEHKLMKQLVKLALSKKGKTGSNPVVAAAIVDAQEHMLGMGVHAKEGGPHAEIDALHEAGQQAKGASLYVTLEPCTHQGKTAPCVQAILRAGIKKVVYAVEDPNPKLRQNPAAGILEAAGIEVLSGLRAKEAVMANDRFFKNMQTQKPLVILKAGLSLDGRIALGNGKSRYLTGGKSLQAVHRIRHSVDGILVGLGTVLCDNPRLTVRLRGHQKSLIKIVMDRMLQTPPESALFLDGGRVILVAEKNHRDPGYPQNAEIWDSSETPNWESLLRKLYRVGIKTLLVEGGTTIFTSLLEEREIDKVALFFAPMFLVGSNAKSLFSGAPLEALNEAPRLKEMQARRIGEDYLISGYLDTRDNLWNF